MGNLKTGRGAFNIVLVAVLVLCAACSASRNSPIELAKEPLPVPDATAVMQTGDLRITPLDMLEIRVFGVSELEGNYQVDHRGLMKMPLIGELSAKGHTTFELAEIIEEKLEATYLQEADVTVLIEESLGRQVTIEGSVNDPGLYPVTGELSLLQAVAMSGGPSRGANPKRVVVFRTVEGERRAAAFNLVDIRNGNASDPSVYGNDIIVVDGSEARETWGEFLRTVPLLALFVAY